MLVIHGEARLCSLSDVRTAEVQGNKNRHGFCLSLWGPAYRSCEFQALASASQENSLPETA